VISRDLGDAAIEAISDDRRFATAYNAALQTGKMVLACAGYRTSGQGHHQTTFEGIEVAIGSPAAQYAALFDACRRKRNMVDYDMSGIATRTEVDQLIDEATAFVRLAEAWIDQNYPSLGRPKA
jgi:hypothetical protein